MLKSALKSSTTPGRGPQPAHNAWDAPDEWSQSSPSLLSSVDTVTNSSARSVGFSSAAPSFSTASASEKRRSQVDLVDQMGGLSVGGGEEKKSVYRVYRVHTSEFGDVYRLEKVTEMS